MQTLPGASSCPESTSVGFGMLSVFVTNLGKYNERMPPQIYSYCDIELTLPIFR